MFNDYFCVSTMANTELEMSGEIIYLNLDTYLAQWLTHEYGTPVVFPKNSYENDLLELSLTTRPKNASEEGLRGSVTVSISLPYFKNKDVRFHNYLPIEGQRALQKCIRSRFIVCLWQDLHKFGNIGKQKQDLIYAWMAAHGIEATESNWNTLAKIYQRRQDAYRKLRRKDNKRK